VKPTTRKPILIAGMVATVAAAVPLVAFGVVPLFVRSTLNEAPPVAVAPSASPVVSTSPSPALVLTGQLRRIDVVHYGSGRVTISGPEGARFLRFENVDIAGAPNMYVYLSDAQDGRPGHFTNLGPLRATNGSFNYPIPATIALDNVRSVVIWCRAFSVTVTYAPLMQPSR
jgi:hypothetical protein